MGNFNKVLLMGNLTRDPELRYTPSGSPVCEFGIATNRSYQTRDGEKRDETCFVDVTMWGRRGAVISEYFKKGDQIFIEGRLQYDTWETAEGRRSKLKVIAENFEFVGSTGGRQGRGGGSPSGGKGSPKGGGRSQPEDRPAREDGPAKEEGEQEGYDVSDDEIPF